MTATITAPGSAPADDNRDEPARREEWITTDGGNIQAGEFGDDQDVIVAVCRFIEVEGVDAGTRLTASNARKLGHALIAAADALDGAR